MIRLYSVLSMLLCIIAMALEPDIITTECEDIVFRDEQGRECIHQLLAIDANSSAADISSYIHSLQERPGELAIFVRQLSEDPYHLQIFITQLIASQVLFKEFVHAIHRVPSVHRCFDQSLHNIPTLYQLFTSALDLFPAVKKEYSFVWQQDQNLVCSQEIHSVPTRYGDDEKAQVAYWDTPCYQFENAPHCPTPYEEIPPSCCRIDTVWKYVGMAVVIAGCGCAGAWSLKKFQHKKSTSRYLANQGGGGIR